MPQQSRAQLLAAAQAFCDGFARGVSKDELVAHFSEDIVVREHGLARLAPFLGRDFRGAQGARTYLEILDRCLRAEGVAFDEFVVDEAERRVVARGAARFTWLETACSWDETFVYVLLFEEREPWMLLRWDVWADSGAAYLARSGVLGREDGVGDRL